ncbi:MAG: site-2 protease family protein [Phototrophicaceae bacterium]|jgi:Zn-dependent protease
MLNELSSNIPNQYAPALPSNNVPEQRLDPLWQDVRAAVSQVLNIVEALEAKADDLPEGTAIQPNAHPVGTFTGTLSQASETAYDALDAQLRPLDCFALFRNSDAPEMPHRVYVIRGRIQPAQGRPWINLLLFILTLLSVFYVGAQYGIAGILEDAPDRAAELTYEDLGIVRLEQLWRGAPYALSIMLILGAHELGHYFAARRHRQSVSLPYFIPMPFTFLGTMGAVIRSREPMKNRRTLMDIGAAGPLAGLVFAIPILFIGLYTSQVDLIPAQGLREGNSALYAVAKLITKGEFLPNDTYDVFMNQMTLAGWLGLLVTGLNLIPVGQLDGGHVLYSLVGRYARRAYYPVIGGMVVLAVMAPQIWGFWVVILFFLGRLYAPPLDDITTLDPRRRAVAIATLVVFALTFVPLPFTIYNNEGAPPPQNNVEAVPPPLAFTLE